MSPAALVAQAPSREAHLSRDDYPLRGRCGDRLAKLIGCGSFEEFSSLFVLTNLVREWPGKNGKGDRFPAAEAREAAERVAMFLAEDSVDRVLLLGRHVAAAFGLAGAPYLTWLEPTSGEPGPGPVVHEWMFAGGKPLPRRPLSIRSDDPRRDVLAGRAECYARGLWLVPERMQFHVWPDARYAVFPHPSGVSRWWNDRKNREAAARFLGDLARRT